MKKNFVGIDLFKLIAAILIVILHSIGNYLGKVGNLFIANICCIAVPFFFIVSGYFFGRGLEKKGNYRKKEYFKKYEKNPFLFPEFMVYSNRSFRREFAMLRNHRI